MTSTDLTVIVAKALEAAGVPYMLVGSFSSNRYGVPRSTKDADFVIELGSKSIGELAPLLGPDFVIDPQMSFETVTGTMRYKLHHPATAFWIELFLRSEDAHDRLRFERRTQATLGGAVVWIAAAEDVVITKLRWSLGASRTKDVDDVKTVLAVQGSKLDLEYVRHWCAIHGSLHVLERLLAEVST